MINNQAQLFLIFLVNGIIIGLLFDSFRILRKSFKTNDFITCFEDFIFWILTGSLVLYAIFKFNNGEIRLYMFIAISIGIIIYMILFSPYFIKINVFIIDILKNIFTTILHILDFPLKLLNRIIREFLFKPTSFIIINIRKMFTSLYKKTINNSNKFKNKEGI